ncbi:MAG TPA: 1,4-alpha-glucan branching protein GlgB [Anaerolineales bacterium]|nr:1,4-alpha-glucan branching protein GlgB [Anaerolineales bacterium]
MTKDSAIQWKAHPEAVAAIAGGYHGNPFDVLGLHQIENDDKPMFVVRAFQPQARAVEVVFAKGKSVPMEKTHDYGFFEVQLNEKQAKSGYRLHITTMADTQYELDDAYRFAPVLGDADLYLHGEGTHMQLYNKMGAHPMEVQGVKGVCFAVWAPNAERVSVIGDFNNWDGRRHPMRLRGNSGIWELFIPALQGGDLYKYEIKTRYMGYMVEKTDPFGFSAELRPRTSSIVWDINAYQWNDNDWMAQRSARQRLDAPISVYELHLGSWMRKPEDGNRFLTYSELADKLIPYLQETAFTHVELLPVTEHPFDGSWGYQAVGYFAPTSRFGTPDQFKQFVDRLHQAGIGVIVDWVPAHFPKDQHGLSFFDGTHLYEHSDPRQGEHMDWGTYIFNFGRNEVQSFLLNSALFWLDKYHIDGLRVDAVASMLYLDYSRKAGEWVPNQFGGRENLEAVAFLKRFNELVHLNYPDVLTFAEESTAWGGVSRPTYLGGLGFDLKWNMGWMHDTLVYIEKEPIHRRYHHGTLTFSLIYAFTENFILPFSHDEVVHGKGSMLSKMPGDYWQKFANLRNLYGYMFTHPGKKLLFMGQEFGQWNEWNYQQSMDWNLLDFDNHSALKYYVGDLNRLVRKEPALHQVDFESRGFEWIDHNDGDNSVISYLRYAHDRNDFVVVVCNFTPVPRFGYRIGVPKGGFYREILNSDSAVYGGSNLGNQGGVQAHEYGWQGRSHSLEITLPPLATVAFKL